MFTDITRSVCNSEGNMNLIFVDYVNQVLKLLTLVGMLVKKGAICWRVDLTLYSSLFFQLQSLQ